MTIGVSGEDRIYVSGEDRIDMAEGAEDGADDRRCCLGDAGGGPDR